MRASTHDRRASARGTMSTARPAAHVPHDAGGQAGYNAPDRAPSLWRARSPGLARRGMRTMKGYVRHSAGRMFDNPVLEWGSKIHPATPFVVYGPLVVGLLAWGFTRGPLHPVSALALFAVGY